MTIFVQYSNPAGGWKSLPPPPTVTVGQQIGAMLLLRNDLPDKTVKSFTVKKQLLNSSGIQVAYNEESQEVAYGKVAFFPITTTNTQKAGGYFARFDVYIGGTWFASWTGNPNVNPPYLIATVKDSEKLPIPPNGDGDDGSTPPPIPPPPDESGTYSYTKVGEATIKNVDQLNNLQSWNTPFKNGDYGLAKLRFPIPLPDNLPLWMKVMFPYTILIEKVYGLELSKAGFSDYMNSYLPAKGVKLWRSVYWEGNYLCIPFVTGIAPLVILAIAAGVALVAGVISISIVLYRLGVKYIETEKEKEIEGQDQILKTIGLIEDPDLQAEVLLKYLGMKTSGESSKSIWEKLFQTPALIIGITISACLIALLVVKVVRR